MVWVALPRRIEYSGPYSVDYQRWGKMACRTGTTSQLKNHNQIPGVIKHEHAASNRITRLLKIKQHWYTPGHCWISIVLEINCSGRDLLGPISLPLLCLPSGIEAQGSWRITQYTQCIWKSVSKWQMESTVTDRTFLQNISYQGELAAHLRDCI